MELCHKILQSIRGMEDSEWKLRFYFIVHHLVPNVAVLYGDWVFDINRWVTKRGTFRLAFFYFADKVLLNFN